MIRLLIVDDEPYTVDGLYEMLGAVTDLKLDMYRAYSAETAMEWLLRTKIDIVLCDIRMPGMSGLELQTRIMEQWTRCKIIFLTGIRQLETAQSAIRNGSVDYILKTEGDEAIVGSIRKAIDRLNGEMLSDQFVLQAKDQLSKAELLLRREWFVGLLDPGAAGSPFSPARLTELQSGLSARLKIMPVVGRADRFPGDATPADRTLLQFAVGNIASEYFGSVAFFPVPLDDSHFVWLIQPSWEGQPGECAADADAVWRKTAAFVRGTLESVQQTSRRLLKVPLSFVCSAYPMAWEALPAGYGMLRRKLVMGLGDGAEMLIIAELDQRVDGAPPLPPIQSIRGKLERLLDRGMEEEFAETVRELFGMLTGAYADYFQGYYAVASALLAQLAAPEPDEPEPVSVDLERLMNVSCHPSKEQALCFLLETAAKVFAARKRMQDESTIRLVQTLHRYIREHLHDDLSLTKLGEVVYLNPAYLSVLYKQHTGTNLSDYIAETRLDKAKALLETTPLKIHEVAEKIGFETAGYFNRFFKSRTNMTPQDYRKNSQGMR